MNDNKVKQNEINSIVWKACDTFRGVMDSSQYKDYILVFLFLKYLSDLWKDKKDEYMKQYKNDKERVARKLKRERFTLPDNCSFDDIYRQRNENNIGEIINIALEKIEENNKEKLSGVFRKVDFNSEEKLGQTKERNARLKNLIDDFSDERLDLKPSKIGNVDIIGNTYEYLIKNFASDAGKKGGEFYTPPEIAELLAKLLEPKSGNRICDPTCGSGSLLIKVAQEIKDKDFAGFGQECNGATWALAKMNMFLHNIDNARIEWGDTIRNPKLIKDDSLMKFDIVVANPPFSLAKWGIDRVQNDRYNRFHRGLPPKSKGDYAFISHMVETIIENTGRVGVVVPLGVLFRSGAEGKIRQKLIEENLIHAVVGLASNLFYGVGIPVALLILKKGRKTKDILFIDASKHFEKGTPQNYLRTEDINKIVDTYKNFKTIDKFSYKATFNEIKENDFNLNIPRYVDTFEEEKEVDIPATKKEIAELESELSEVKIKIDGYLKELEI